MHRDAVRAVPAVDFMRGERRGAAVQRGGKRRGTGNRDRCVSLHQDLNSGNKIVSAPPHIDSGF